MPKVLHLIHESRSGGGMTIALTYFHRYLPHFETVAITGNLGPLAEKLRQQGVTAYALPLDSPRRAVLSIPKIVSVLRREKPDVVIVHGQWGGFCGAVAARWVGIKHVLYYTQMPCFYTDWDLFRILRNRFAEEKTCAIASRVVALSQAGRYQYLMRRLALEEKLLHIPNGIEIEKIQPVADKKTLRRELNLPENAPLVVCVGRLEDQKRVDWLVDAWQAVEAQCPAAHLAIVGDGSERVALEQLSQKLGLQRCHFLGVQPQGFRYFQAADVGVITSMFEGHPFSLLEAMAAGCPMVGTAADGIPETIVEGMTGFCVPPADIPQLAEKIISLLTHPEESARMGRQARERVQAHYTVDVVIEKQLELVRALLAESR